MAGVKGTPKPPGSGRQRGTQNKKQLLGKDFAATLIPAAKRRIKALINGTNDDLALRAAVKVLEYQFGKPKEHKVVGGDGGEPIRRELQTTSSLAPDKELARRISLALKKAEEPKEIPPTSGRQLTYTNGSAPSAATKPTNGHAELEPGHELPLGDGVVAKLEAADGRGGGDWSVEQNGKQVKRLPGLDISGVKDWHEAAVLESFYE